VKKLIKKHNVKNEFYTPEKCYITELSNSPDDPTVSIARARVIPGETTRWHRLKETAERYFILEGMGRMEIGDLQPHVVQPGDIALIPPMCRQRITNIVSEDLIFLAICTPRFSKDEYEDIDE